MRSRGRYSLLERKYRHLGIRTFPSGGVVHQPTHDGAPGGGVRGGRSTLNWVLLIPARPGEPGIDGVEKDAGGTAHGGYPFEEVWGDLAGGGGRRRRRYKNPGRGYCAAPQSSGPSSGETGGST